MGDSPGFKGKNIITEHFLCVKNKYKLSLCITYIGNLNVCSFYLSHIIDSSRAWRKSFSRLGSNLLRLIRGRTLRLLIRSKTLRLLWRMGL